MNGHHVHNARAASEGGRGKLRRRLTVVALLIGLGAAASVVPAPESPLERLTNQGHSQVSP